MYEQDITSTILLQAADLSTSNAEEHPQKYGFDEETLRELCGCLITVTMNQARATTVGFAHYTVLEYLKSQRITAGLTSIFALCENIVYRDLLRVVFREALRISPGDFQNIQDVNFDKLDEEIHVFCTATTFDLLAFEPWQQRISLHADLQELAFELLRPFRRGFSNLGLMILRFLLKPNGTFDQREITLATTLLQVEWLSTNGCEEVAILLNLLWFGAFPLAEALLRRTKIRDLFRRKVSFRSRDSVWRAACSDEREWLVSNHTYELPGTIVEVAAQLVWRDHYALPYLIERGAGSFDPSRILHLYSGMWSPTTKGETKEDTDRRYLQYGVSVLLIAKDVDVLTKLLRLGADPHLAEYRLTPLQIAVAWRDDDKVRVLLEHGADPSKVGNKNGISWGDGSVMQEYNQEILDLYDVGPLEISGRALERPPRSGRDSEKEDDRQAMIETMLLEKSAVMHGVGHGEGRGRVRRDGMISAGVSDSGVQSQTEGYGSLDGFAHSQGCSYL
ncbi:hypothetical protein IMZ48_10900 [Candidatus Bathyarchaeota archaeon]|nr:hypothetical protein [Candidatus Bathyarchaeota archaeon]